MPRNRKNKPIAVTFGAALKTLVICLATGGICLGYVWQVNQIYTLGLEKKQCETKLRELQRQNKMHRDRLDYYRLPWVLEAKIKELNLGLVPPQPDQVLRLNEAGVSVPQTPKLAQLAEPTGSSSPGRTLR